MNDSVARSQSQPVKAQKLVLEPPPRMPVSMTNRFPELKGYDEQNFKAFKANEKRIQEYLTQATTA